MRTTTEVVRRVLCAVVVGTLCCAGVLLGQNLIVNGGFDEDLSGWMNRGAGSATWSSMDASEPLSGSARITTTAGQHSGFGLLQCLPAQAGQLYTSLVEALVPSGQSEPGRGFLSLDWYADASCSESAFISQDAVTTAGTVGQWVPLAVTAKAPPGAKSVSILLRSHKDTDAVNGQPFRVHVDNAVFGQGCVPDEFTLCLNKNGRFKVQIEWRDFFGNTGRGHAVDLGRRDSGAFWFFSEENLEMLVKVRDACKNPNFESFWVFFAATTNVEFTLTVTDTKADESKEYFNPLEMKAEPVQDVAAFKTCP